MSGPVRPQRRIAVLALLLLGLVFAAWIALGLGPTPTGWADVQRLVRGEADPATRAILLDVRLPRLLLAALVGAALSGAGTAFQATLRNPLADPYILGVSGGAALGAVIFTALAGSGHLGSPLGRPLAAFAGAMSTLVILFYLARVRGRTDATSLLLLGVVLNAFDSAVILFLVTASDASRLQGVLQFLVGSLSSPSWSVLASVAVLVGAGLTGLFLLSHRLNLLSLGEEAAGHLGVDIERMVWTVLLAASLITAAAVAFTGLVGFVGLMVPHAVRTVLGPDHRVVLPAAAIGGAAFVVLTDTVARLLVAPAEMPVGVVTALLGAPFFLVLFLRRLRETA